jgi:bifunctional UDP-N-acetylglucosamine pyrophosphorylase/glucosamine-1-phosphate N-acetyltransferase
MRSSRPKHVHPLLGRRLLDWVVAAAEPLGAAPLLVVCSPAARPELESTLPRGVELVVQEQPRGTGDAVAATRPALTDFSGDLLVLAGDTPLLRAEMLQELVDEHRRQGASLTVLSFEPQDAGAYGRIVRDDSGHLSSIVEAADAAPEQLAIREVNSSVFVFAVPTLWEAIERLDSNNAKGELLLTDVILHLVVDGRTAAVFRASDPRDLEGVNTRAELAQAAAVLRDRILLRHMLDGVTIVDPATTWIEADVEIEPDAVVNPFTVLRGRTRIGAEAEVGPHVVAVDARIEARALVGPFCHLRPGACVGTGAKVGTFVEVKNSTIGAGAKVPHLSYIGDAEIGEGSNIGAGAITANYRPELGSGKQRTVIGRNVHTGSHNVFVAPVEIGDGAWIGAGSTITEDVPPDALAIARARQVNKEGYGGGKRRD